MNMISKSSVTGYTAHACDYYQVTADLDINKCPFAAFGISYETQNPNDTRQRPFGGCRVFRKRTIITRTEVSAQ